MFLTIIFSIIVLFGVHFFFALKTGFSHSDRRHTVMFLIKASKVSLLFVLESFGWVVLEEESGAKF